MSELDPGIRKVVAWLNENGFRTTDSGDGVSKPGVGDPESCSLPYPNVAIAVSPDRMLSECDRLITLIEQRSIEVGSIGPEDSEEPCIQGTYDPACRSAIIVLMNLDDKRLGET